MASIEAFREVKPNHENVDQVLAYLNIIVDSKTKRLLPWTGISNITAYLATMMIMSETFLLASEEKYI